MLFLIVTAQFYLLKCYFLTVRPLRATILGKNGSFSAGKSHELTCEVVGARPPPEITWWKGHEQLTSTRETVSCLLK